MKCQSLYSVKKKTKKKKKTSLLKFSPNMLSANRLASTIRLSLHNKTRTFYFFVSECIHPIGEGYPVFQLFSGDKYIQYTSKHIYKEEKINPMFRELGVPEQKIYSEHDRYIHQKQEYNDMTTHLLQTWIQQAGRNATFDVLCNMLNKHEFQSVTQELLGLSNEPD